MKKTTVLRQGLAVACGAFLLSMAGGQAVPYVSTATVEAASAITKTTKDGFVIKKGVLTKYTGKGGKITIPKGVTKIDRSVFKYNTKITSVTIPSTVKTIDEKAFMGCTKLKSVTLTKGLTYIKYKAFANCSSLTSLTLPSGVKLLDSKAVEGCVKLEKLTLPASLTSISLPQFYGSNIVITVKEGNAEYASIDGVLYNKEKTELLYCPSNRTGMFEVPEGVTTIRYQAFYKSKISGVSLPASVVDIDNSSFNGCSKLSTATISEANTVYSIKNGLLLNKEGTEVIRNLAQRTGTVTIPDGIVMIQFNAFRNFHKIETVLMPDSVKKIEYFAFRGCDALKEVQLGNSLTYIGSGAFYDCVTLSSIQLPKSLQVIANIAFFNCGKLSDITFPASLMAIGESAFDKTGLTSITIPGSVEEIGVQAFANCKSLESVTICEGVKTMEASFYDCPSLKTLSIPASMTGIYRYSVEDLEEYNNLFSGCTSLTNLTVADENPVFMVKDHILYNKEQTVVYSVLPSVSGKVKIPAGVTEIRAVAVAECNSITKVELPATLKTIGMQAFRACGKIEKITIPKSVTTVGIEAFYGCNSLKKVTVESEFNTDLLRHCMTSDVDGVQTVAAQVSVGKGETLTVVPSYLLEDYKDSLQYTSKSKSIATVTSKGKITAKKTGTAKIIISCKKSKKTLELTVNVKKAPTKVSVPKKEISLSVQERYKIKHTLSKGSVSRKITYESKDKKIATVSKYGNITAVKKGTTTITVKTYNGKTAKIKVTVK